MSKNPLLGISGLFSCIFFVVDLSLPLGIAAGIPYVILVLLGLLFSKWKYTISLAILASFLTVLGYFISDPGSSLWIALTNRSFTFFVIWVTTAFIIFKIRSDEGVDLAASVFSNIREGVIISDCQFKIIDVNDTFTKITGYSRDEALGQDPFALQAPDTFTLQAPGRQSHEFNTAMWETVNTTGYWVGEVWNSRKNGELYPASLTRTAVKNNDGEVTHYIAHFSDISKQKELQSKQKENQSHLEYMANYDQLTGLPNRTLLADRLNQAIIQSNRDQSGLAVLFLDIDNFKEVNDTYGHSVGDRVLIAFSHHISEVLREVDTLARIGGDEFIAVLADLPRLEEHELVLERILLAASETVTVDETIFQMSASIGVTYYPQDNVGADILMRHADQAMYLAKQAGKNRYHLFDTEYDYAVNIRRESLDSIIAALDKREFVLHYQPKVNMATGEIVGVEALVRWQHPVRGLVPPLDFLPIIEGQPISIVLGEWVINTALDQISQWQSMGITLPISVNISAYQLQQTNFVTRLTALLANHPEVSPYSLELEVLETGAVSDINSVSVAMYACKDLGINFALDDFGTGYSSLTHLRHLPASWIKIDQSFVRDMLDNPDDLAIIKGVISLAKAFQRNIIAEGVETIEHGTALLELGCQLAQGYGIARPMPASDIPVWMGSWKPDVAWRGKGIIQIINQSLKENILYQNGGLERVDIELLKAAVMDSRDGITISDFTKPDNPLIFINPAFEAMTGHSMEDVIHQNCRYLQGDDRDQPGREIIRHAINNMQPCVVTLRNYRKDGSMFWNELSLSPIVGSEGLATHYLGVQKDVTSRILLEEEIQSENKGS